MEEKERAEAAEPSDCVVVLITAAPPTASKATTAQRFFAPEGGPDRALLTASFALRSW